jgi:hypothetical protein
VGKRWVWAGAFGQVLISSSQVATPRLRSRRFDRPPDSLTVTHFDFHLTVRMTRATRFTSYASAVTLCYFLAWFSVIPIPLIAEETKDQIIPLVRDPLNHSKPFRLTPFYRVLGINCSFRGGCWYRSGLIPWHRSDGDCGRSGIARMRIRN